MSAASSGRNAVLDEEDAALWAHVVAQVRPLRKTASLRATDKPKPKKTDAARVAPTSAQKTAPAPVRASPKPLAPDARERLPRTDERRLRRGSVAVAGRLDLHGLSRDEAHRAVMQFLSRLVEEGARVALVITGKGGSKVGERGSTARGEGILRSELPRWLSEGVLARSVLAWRPAAPRHGGEGAFYVLLRRKAER